MKFMNSELRLEVSSTPPSGFEFSVKQPRALRTPCSMALYCTKYYAMHAYFFKLILNSLQ